MNARGTEGQTALIKSAAGGALDLVQALIGRGADVNAKDNDGRTALLWAASDGYLDVVKFLVAHGADAGARDRDGDTAAKLASKNGHPNVVQFLEAGSAEKYEGALISITATFLLSQSASSFDTRGSGLRIAL